MVGGEFNLDPRRNPHRHLESGTQACNRVWFMRSQVDLAGVIVAAIRMTTMGGLFTQPSQSMHVKAIIALGWVLFPWALGVKYMGAKKHARPKKDRSLLSWTPQQGTHHSSKDPEQPTLLRDFME